MDFKIVLLAIVLSILVLVFWATFFEQPVIEQQTAEKKLTKNEDLSSPSIEEKEGMDLDPEWKKRVEEKLLQEEDQREEKKYLLKLSSQNDQI